MVERIKKVTEPIAAYWKKISKTMKIVLVSAVVGIIVLSVAATVLVNKNNASYTVLFPGMSRQESMEVFAALQSREIPARRTAEGEVTVPEERVGEAMLEMAVLGYPKTTMPFDTFSSNSGFTTTEFEKKQYLLFNLQERMELTIRSMTGVKSAAVTITVPQENNYVWNESKGKSTASITMTMLPGYTISPQRVSALKRLLADSVPQLLPENVSVINGETMEEMVEDIEGEDKYGLDRLGFESEIEKRIENKIKKVLSLGYAPNDVMVSATVVIDYDKMITENLQYVPEASGDGVKKTIDERYQTDKGDVASGIPGEEANTDIPLYEAQPGGDNGYADYQRKIDYLVGEIKSQIEKDYAKLKYATVAITVKDNELTQEKQTALIETASKAANIPVENISLNNFTVPVEPESNSPVIPAWLKSPFFWVGLVLMLIAMVVGIAVILRMNKKRKEALASEAQQADTEAQVKRIEEQQVLSAQQRELEDYRSKLKQQAEMGGSKNSVVAEEMKQFAQENPELTASMIRNWLKEGEDE